MNDIHPKIVIEFLKILYFLFPFFEFIKYIQSEHIRRPCKAPVSASNLLASGPKDVAYFLWISLFADAYIKAKVSENHDFVSKQSSAVERIFRNRTQRQRKIIFNVCSFINITKQHLALMFNSPLIFKFQYLNIP